MNRPLIIGFGNTLRRDDGAGVHAAGRVAAEADDVDVVIVHELAPELAASLSGRDLVVFVDASTRAPRLAMCTVEPAREPLGSLDHALLPADIVSLCGLLYPPAPPRVLLMEVPAFDCEFGETMTPATERMVGLCVDAIRDLLAGTRAADPSGLSPVNSLPR